MNEETQRYPFVSVVIITRNRPEILAQCLTYLSKQYYLSFETIIIDSSSNNETANLMEEWPKIRYFRILNAKNNMPRARNVGISKARGDFLAFIDDDCMVSKSWLQNLVIGYEEPDIGGVGGMVIDKSYSTPGENRIGKILQDGTLIRNFAKRSGELCDVDWFPGCNMSFRREVLNQTDGFDINYSGNNSFEDVDQSVRVRQAGYRLRFIPQASVIHLAAPRNPDIVQRDYESPIFRFYQSRNGAYFYLKNFGISHRFSSHFILRNFNNLTKYTLKHPSAPSVKRWFATLLGNIAGFITWSKYQIRRI